MPWRASCRETGTAGSASALEKRTGSNPGTALQADSTSGHRAGTVQFASLLTGQLPADLDVLGPGHGESLTSAIRDQACLG
jgi:hypothetical protein